AVVGPGARLPAGRHVDVLHGGRPRLVVGVVVLRREWFEPELLGRKSEWDDEAGRDEWPLHHTHIFLDPAARCQMNQNCHAISFTLGWMRRAPARRGVAATPRPLQLRLEDDLRREVELDHVTRVDARNTEFTRGGGLRRAGTGDRGLRVHPVHMALGLEEG